MDEEIIWTGKPSHIRYLATYSTMIIIAMLLFFNVSGYYRYFIIIPAFWNVWNYLLIEYSGITVTNQRIIIRHGIFNRYSEEIELFRIKDLSISKPFLYRLNDCGNLEIITSDKSSRKLTLQAIHGVEQLKELLRNNVVDQRKNKGVREFDINL
jgi:uncharacterized membrane protein YdbT with pleckstrin-like domain